MHRRMNWKIDRWAADFSAFFLEGAVYERSKECFLRRLLRDHSGTSPIEVNNFDKSKRKSLFSALRVDVIGKPGPVFYQLKVISTTSHTCTHTHTHTPKPCPRYTRERDESWMKRFKRTDKTHSSKKTLVNTRNRMGVFWILPCFHVSGVVGKRPSTETNPFFSAGFMWFISTDYPLTSNLWLLTLLCGKTCLGKAKLQLFRHFSLFCLIQCTSELIYNLTLPL